ncbi:MAG: DUF3301 domain-containing protein [Gammaproteobacteria bacterium]|nr:MAG: DUF3301 domain-containing protein [Gammaproteobacteria bacterium]
MMSTALLLITLIGLLTWLWLDGARARELATRLAQTLCERRGLQFLDGTVALRRMGVRRKAGGLRIRRMFSFDYSREGSGRHLGWIILLGTDIELVQLDEPEERATVDGSSTSEPASHDDRGKVVPFRPPRRRN